MLTKSFMFGREFLSRYRTRSMFPSFTAKCNTVLLLLISWNWRIGSDGKTIMRPRVKPRPLSESENKRDTMTILCFDKPGHFPYCMNCIYTVYHIKSGLSIFLTYIDAAVICHSPFSSVQQLTHNSKQAVSYLTLKGGPLFEQHLHTRKLVPGHLLKTDTCQRTCRQFLRSDTVRNSGAVQWGHT